MGTLLIVAADEYEFTGIRKRGSGWKPLSWPLVYAAAGILQGRHVTLVANGPGPRLAEIAFDVALRDRAVDAVISTGSCGGLDPSLAVGDVIACTAVLQAETGRLFETRPLRPATAVITGTIASQDRVAVTREDKRLLREQGASAVEMEAAGIAARAEQERIPFSCIRAVSDSSVDRMPLDFNLYRDAEGRFRRGAIAMAALMKPLSRIPALLRLQRNAMFASEKLGEFFASSSL